ncbi:MAG TPA: hypothetical protein VMV49_12950 [Candidatus Deferrimicrobium sp.]|nr:hypothetical protein [Candidatus Deferrimicrobium sp.]
MEISDFALILWIINLIEMLIVAYIFYREYKLHGTRFYIGVALFYVLFVFARLSELIRFYLYPSSFPPYYTLDLNFWLKTTYTMLSYIGLTIIYFVLERYIFKGTKYFFTILVPITTVLSIWMTVSVAYYDLIFSFVIPLYLLILFGIICMYIYLAIKTSGEVRKNSIMIIFGILLFELGLVFALPEAQKSIWAAIPTEIIILLAPIFSIIGVLLQIRGFKTSIS